MSVPGGTEKITGLWFVRGGSIPRLTYVKVFSKRTIKDYIEITPISNISPPPVILNFTGSILSFHTMSYLQKNWNLVSF